MTTENKSCIMEMEKFPARVFQFPHVIALNAFHYLFLL